MGDTADIYRRHVRERPVKGLTDDELGALIKVGEHLALFEDGLAERLGMIVELAHAEDNDRVHQEMRGQAAATSEEDRDG